MLGLLLAFLSSFFWATNDLFTKRFIHKGFDEYFVLWVRFPVSSLFLLPAGIIFWDLRPFILLSTFLWLPVEVLGGVFFVKALKYAPLSVAMSFYSFMPIFSALFGFLLLREAPNLWGFVGICLMVIGMLFLTGFSPKEFFKKHIGTIYMLISTLLFGFNVVLGKIVVINSNPFFFSWYYAFCMSFSTLIFVSPKHILKKENYADKRIIVLGILFALGSVLYNLALLYAPASYVASVERISLLLSILYGKVFFGESLRYLLPGAMLMLLGSLLLSISLHV
ncbi:DMT family transporter [Hydrogenobacter thermophilus]|uniref:DMT family transporter n=1 Tax=Hydrogenobacter thermophilus TaxID=940 RepID=UPI0030F8F93B